jgi:medium-chain acyl-[acyl-carrier-protein] hydrolase
VRLTELSKAAVTPNHKQVPPRVPSKPKSEAAIRLFCFPYAGGGAWIYKRWQEGLPRNIEVNAIELPGRGARRNEPPSTAMPALIESVLPLIRRQLDRPYALFGHSLGAYIAMELASALRSARLQQPCHVFLSGANPPQAFDPDPIHDLPTGAFTERIRLMGGTPPEFFDNPELLLLSLPVLRADFKLSSASRGEWSGMFEFPITVLMGQRDPTTSADIAARWRAHTCGGFRIQGFPGDHFFVNEQRRAVLDCLAVSLAPFAT